MDGKGHLMFAPFFSCLATSLMVTTGMVPPVAESLQITVCIATALSFVTAKIPDADQIALKPKPIIMGTAPTRYSQKYQREYNYVVLGEKDFVEQYGQKELEKFGEGKSDVKGERTKTGKYLVYYDKSGTKDKLMLIFALMYKAMGLKKHRGWQSHSPLLWCILLLFAVLAVYSVPNGDYLGLVVLGLACGYLSHIVGDAFTKGGVEILPDFYSGLEKLFPNQFKRRKKKKSIAGKGLKSISGAKFQPMKYIPFAKSGSKVWSVVLCIMMGSVFSYIFLPEFFNFFWGNILLLGGQLVTFLKWLLTTLKGIFISLMK